MLILFRRYSFRFLKRTYTLAHTHQITHPHQSSLLSFFFFLFFILHTVMHVVTKIVCVSQIICNLKWKFFFLYRHLFQRIKNTFNRFVDGIWWNKKKFNLWWAFHAFASNSWVAFSFWQWKTFVCIRPNVEIRFQSNERKNKKTLQSNTVWMVCGRHSVAVKILFHRHPNHSSKKKKKKISFDSFEKLSHLYTHTRHSCSFT